MEPLRCWNIAEAYHERDRTFRKNNPDVVKRIARNYHLRHHERILARQRMHRLTSPETARQYVRDYRKRHPERVPLIARKSRLKHPEAANARKRNYYARKKQAQGTHTARDIQEQYIRQKGRCYYCHRKLGKQNHEYHVDHVIPITRGGSNTPDNLVIACPKCNCSKHNKLPHEWPQGGRLL